jgi:hypothetical protein
LRKSTKFVFEFCGLDPSGKLAPVDIATFSCFNQDFLRFFAQALCSFLATTLSQKTFQHFMLEKNLKATPLAFTFSKSTCRLFFSVEIPSWMGPSGPQLAAVPGLFRWESLNGWDFLGHNLLLSQACFGGNPLMDGIFWATTCCCLRPLFPRWNSGCHEAFLTNFFLFSRWNSGYHEAFLTIFFLFSRWNSGYHEAFLTMFFLFSRWNSGYDEAFLTNFFLFSRWNSGYDEAFLTNLFLFSRWNSGYEEAFLTNLFLFSRWNSRDTQFGGRLFSYIYHKEYLHRIRFVKNLAS